MTSPPPQPGGFLPASSGLLSPPPSTIASPSPSTASTAGTGSTLPRPRAHPLKSGSAKESAFINHVDAAILMVSRRFALRGGGVGEGGLEEDGEEGVQVMRGEWEDRVEGRGRERGGSGYESFGEAARDIERLVDVVWVSGTPGLQVPYLLSLALLVVTYIPAFPPTPRAMFRVLGKLDMAFASLVLGRDVESGMSLPGFLGLRGISGTEKVRIKSLIERTRVVVVEVMMKGEVEEEDGEDADGDRDDEMVDYDAGTDFAMEVARVYDRTLVELGDSLGGPAIGIPGQ